MKLTDWYVDGHFIAAATPEGARNECIRMYGHDPEIVREWRKDDA